MPYRDAEDREQRLREDLARLDRILADGAMTKRQYVVARRRIEASLGVVSDQEGAGDDWA